LKNCETIFQTLQNIKKHILRIQKASLMRGFLLAITLGGLSSPGAEAPGPYASASTGPYAVTTSPHAGATAGPYAVATTSPHAGAATSPHAGATAGPYAVATTSPHAGAATSPHAGAATSPHAGATTGPCSDVTTGPCSNMTAGSGLPGNWLNGCYREQRNQHHNGVQQDFLHEAILSFPS
jgi:hypothetical protein